MLLRLLCSYSFNHFMKKVNTPKGAHSFGHLALQPFATVNIIDSKVDIGRLQENRLILVMSLKRDFPWPLLQCSDV